MDREEPDGQVHGGSHRAGHNLKQLSMQEVYIWERKDPVAKGLGESHTGSLADFQIIFPVPIERNLQEK